MKDLTLEDRVALLEKTVKKQRVMLKKQEEFIAKLFENFKRLLNRTELLRKAVPHVSFGDW